MKYVLMYTNRPDLDAAVPPERQQAVYQAIYAWFGRARGVRSPTAGPSCSDRRPPPPSGPATAAHRVVVDGPFSEAKENIGGFSVIDVPDIDAAIALVKTWPSLELPGVAIEIRPMVEDYSHMPD